MFRQIGLGEVILIVGFLVLMAAAITTVVLVCLRMAQPTTRRSVGVETAKHRR